MTRFNLLWLFVDFFGLISINAALLLLYGFPEFEQMPRSAVNTLLGSNLVFILCVAYLHRALVVPGFHTISRVLPAMVIAFGVLLLGIVFLRVEYSRSALLWCFLIATLWFQLRLLLQTRYNRVKLLLVPSPGLPLLHITDPRMECHVLDSPELGSRRFDAVVADLRADFSPQWQKFITGLGLSNIPVYDAATVYENISGRVSLGHVSKSTLGRLSPSRLYLRIKRVTDFFISLALFLLLSPLFAAIAAVTALHFRRSPFFSQERTGYLGRRFRIYKFRTMRDSEVVQAQVETGRLTRWGRFLRRFRLDELPQLWNVLTGDMNLIGPRPLMDLGQNEGQIPFYRHRYSVPPGISGWAQISQEYAPDEDTAGVREKLERDFYYIKYLSPWLDFLIIVMTFIAVLSGKGIHRG